ncbi:MAG TPA: hypothetical protein PKK36_07990 [Kiritimatiellia bacterium]|nr:hypothetical protein [Kiritimatiellia bacterium]HNR94533.1 hypothetical protein [Kiritimatiellia bacterium]HPA77627.1 hypothetical protein [Kiritimatiellia bacterium]HQQ03676.1 hypothetical protein [Kiritimatiellia bacterium]
MKWFVSLFAAVLTVSLMSGCAMFRASTSDVDLSDTSKHFDADFDATDMRGITESVAAELLAGPFLQGQAAPPITMIAGIQNRTSNYVDTKNLTDRMRTILLKSGKMQFVNEARREELLAEQGYQAAHATADTQVGVGKQLGAKFMITGSLTEMRKESPKQVRISKQEWNYYKLTMEVTDLETGLIAWTTEKEFARQASKPLIGW